MPFVQPLQYYQRAAYAIGSLSSRDPELSDIDAGYCIDAPENLPAGFFQVLTYSYWEDYIAEATNAYDDALVPRGDTFSRPSFNDGKFLLEIFDSECRWLVDFNTLYSDNKCDEDFLDWLRSATPGSKFAGNALMVTAI